jgi:hypothetical protein
MSSMLNWSVLIATLSAIERLKAAHLLSTQVVPDGQKRLLAGDRAGNEAIEFVVRPAFVEERFGEDHDTEAARADSVVDFPTQAVPDPHLGLIEPHYDAPACECISQRPKPVAR